MRKNKNKKRIQFLYKRHVLEIYPLLMTLLSKTMYYEITNKLKNFGKIKYKDMTNKI